MILERSWIVIIARDVHLEAAETLFCTQNRKKNYVQN